MRKSTVNRGISLIIILIMAIGVIAPQRPVEAAANSYIKIYNFIKLLVPAAGIEVDTSQSNPYLKAAMGAGIVKEGDFKDYKAYITRMDAAVLLNRADEYMHGDTVDKELLKIVADKRISDIKKIPAGKREAVAKIYAKGFIVGKSNGMYIQNRSFNGADNLSAGDVKKVLALLKNDKARAKISPDGQLIRTNNLPKNAKDYPYILEAFPNSFYEMKFLYQRGTYSWVPVEGKDYARPIRVNKTMSNLENDKNGKCIYVSDWITKVENNLKYRFNVDYKTIDKNWLNSLRGTYFMYQTEHSNKKMVDEIKEYMVFVKEKKISIKSAVISVEPSSLYNDQGFWVRAYVKFKISYLGDTLPQNKLFFVQQLINFKGLNRDKWFEGIYDIQIATANGSSNGSDFAVFDDSLNDYYYKGK